jgi:molybdate transport system regulatory protein
MKARSKIWIETDGGELVMGEGRLEILEAVEREGSLSAAARSLGMSYRAVWGKVRDIEARLGMALVTGKSGGCDHGGATLTPEARRLARAFRALEERSRTAVERFTREAGLDSFIPRGAASAPRAARAPARAADAEAPRSHRSRARPA